MSRVAFRGLGPSGGAEYQRAYRIQNEEYAERNRLLNNARHAALQRLKEQHRGEFEAIFAEERKDRGLR